MRRSARRCASAPRTIVHIVAVLAASHGLAHAQSSTLSSGSAFTLEDVLDVYDVGVEALSEDGRWIAVTAASLRDRIGIDNYRYGDPTYVRPSVSEVWVIDTRGGEKRRVFPEKRQVEGMAWSPDGSELALVVKGNEEFELVVWERASGEFRRLELPREQLISVGGRGGADLTWTPDGRTLLVPLHSYGWREEARARFLELTEGPIVVLSSEDPFLAWDAVRNLSSRRSLAAIDVSGGPAREILPEGSLLSYDLAEDGSFITYAVDIAEKTSYERNRGSETQVKLIPSDGGTARVIIESTKGIRPIWSEDGRHYAYSKDRDVYFASVDDEELRRLIGEDERDEAAPTAEEEEDNEDEEEGFRVVSLNPDGERLIASNDEGLWIIDTDSGKRELFISQPEDDDTAPSYEVEAWDPEGEALYLSYASRTHWERGLVRYDVASKRLDELVKDARLYSGLRVSADGSTLVFSVAEGNRPSDVYVADPEFRTVTRLTEANPDLETKRLSRTELVDYLDVDGETLYGVLYYPVDYQPGNRYPTVFLVYEDFFDNRFRSDINLLTNHGYAVMQPSVKFETGYPEEAWMKGVTAAANELIEMGIADPDRLGVHGTSYGGYAVNLLVTQTDRFAAAINISGKVNMISFYTDSPRLGIRNIRAPEWGQDRVGASLWEQPQKYLSTSAIMDADRIDTPLLLITGQQDYNVPARQAMEMYYALRRLGKRVEWVEYVNGGHGTPTSTVEEVKDYHSRILSWYERYLKADGTMTAVDSN